MIKKYFSLWIVAIALTTTIVWGTPATAQLPLLPKISWETFKLDRNLDDTVISACVRLDGNCIFELSDRKSKLAQRIRYTEERLAEIQKTYLQQESPDVKVLHRGDRNSQSIYVVLGERELTLLTLNNSDASFHSVPIEDRAQRVASKTELGLKQSRKERQGTIILQKAKIGLAIMLLSALINYLLWRRSRSLKRTKVELVSENSSESLVVDLEQKKKINLQEVKYRLVQFLHFTVWLASLLSILGLFPQTRIWQLWVITLVRIPLRLVIVTIACYLLIRLSYAAIARTNSALSNNIFANNYVFNPETNRRLQVRINTFSRLFRGIVTLIWVGISLFVALAILGLNIAPLLAGAGVLGLAFSFASQNLIKDTINGLLIILEDQYAVGDVVTIGDTGGMVETLNLRITQLRDGEGRLITIPNSSITKVANHSNGWSRSDLKIPFTYQTNADRAIEIVQQVATQMYEDCDCREKILEPPLVLGVEEFGDRGYLVRLWFKTEPLKQWEVAREFRRRMRNAFETAGIDLPLPHQEIWLNRH